MTFAKGAVFLDSGNDAWLSRTPAGLNWRFQATLVITPAWSFLFAFVILKQLFDRRHGKEIRYKASMSSVSPYLWPRSRKKRPPGRASHRAAQEQIDLRSRRRPINAPSDPCSVWRRHDRLRSEVEDSKAHSQKHLAHPHAASTAQNP